jgi:hypothetical protein
MRLRAQDLEKRLASRAKLSLTLINREGLDRKCAAPTFKSPCRPTISDDKNGSFTGINRTALVVVEDREPH